MKKAIYFRLLALTFISIALYGIVTATITMVGTRNQTQSWLTTLTLATAQLYNYNNDVMLLSQTAGGNRVTIIAPNGNVIADSSIDYTLMENRAQREEVRYARTDEVFILIRTSTTLGEQFMYATVIADDDNIIRLAYSYPGFLYTLFLQLPAMLSATVVALVLSVFLATKFTQTVTNPLEILMKSLAKREYEQLRDYQSPYPEINSIMLGIEPLLQQISKSRQSLLFEQEKVNHILAHMAAGFVLLDYEETILLCNNAVKGFFNADQNIDFVGQNLLTLVNQKEINHATERAFRHGHASIFELIIHDDLILSVHVSPTHRKSKRSGMYGATILFVDVTNDKLLEKQKREFFSNASHELKTPITSILGFSEMISQNIVQTDEQKNEILKRIEIEARRMSELINNLLLISKLESSSWATAINTDFNFADVITEAIDSVSPLKDGEPVEIELLAVDVAVYASKQQLYEMCVNLIENAVKYNKPHGKVTVELRAKRHHVILRVTDTGIGIPSEHQARIFERFFRVDYGRDKKVGGSGLGLSIVKHIVTTHGGEISLKSRKDYGTTIEIRLPIVREQ